jgi:hypothetical protein
MKISVIFLTLFLHLVLPLKISNTQSEKHFISKLNSTSLNEALFDRKKTLKVIKSLIL